MAGIIKYYNLTGGLNTVQGLGTINQSPKRTESPDMMNVEYYKLGGIQSMEGNRQFANTLPSSITLGYEYIYQNTKYMIVCTSDGTIYRYDKPSGEFVQIYKFATPTERHSICTFNNGIVISNGVDDLVFYQYGRHQLLSGSLALTKSSVEVTGTDTKFLTDLSIGDYIEFADIEGKFKVVTITDNTHLTLDKAPEFTATQLYYAWTNGDTTLYTTTTDNSSSINVYNIDGTSVSVAYTNGTITNNVLSIQTRQEVTQQGTGYKDWTQPIPSSNTSYGTISGNIDNPYTLFAGGGHVFSYGTVSLTWNFPVTLRPTSIMYDAFEAGPSKLTVRVYNQNNTLLSVREIDQTVGEYLNFIDTFNTIADTTSLRLEFSCPLTSGGFGFAGISNIKIYGKEKYSYNYTQEQLITTNYNYNSDSNQTLNTNISNVNYYLSDIAELNAVYTTNDDNIRKEVRGLALNSYQGRIFVGANDGTLYYSGVGLIHGWNLQNQDAGAIPSFYDDNSDFTALGLWDKYLVICKRERSYLLDGTNADQSQWSLNPYSDYTCDSQQSWLVANNSFIVYSRSAGGIYPLLQRTIYNPNYQGVDMSTKIRDSFYNLNESKFPFIFPVYHPRKKYIMFYMPFIYGNGSNYCYIFDLQTKTWLLRVVPQEVTCAFRYDNVIFIGTRTGKILEEFKGYNFDGEPIEFYWKSPFFTFGQGTDYLSTREFRVSISEDSLNKFYVRNRRDGESKSNSRLVTQGIQGGNTLIWNTKDSDGDNLTETTWNNYNWAISKYSVKRFPLPKQFFQQLQIEFYGKGLDQGMRIFGFEIDGIQLEEVPWR